MNNSTLQQLQFTDIERLLRSNEISYFNIYNGDIHPTTYLSTKYYYDHPYDNIDIDQKIRSIFIDIELFSTENTKVDLDLSKAEIPINAVSIIDNITKEINVFFLLIDKNVQLFGILNDPTFNYDQFIIDKQNMIKKYLIDNNYIDMEYSIKLNLYSLESELLKNLWMTIHFYDPDVLSGWNIDFFDMPYTYNRLTGLFGVPDANRLMSKFGKVTLKNDHISIPDYTISDLLYLYKPRDEGGLVN